MGVKAEESGNGSGLEKVLDRFMGRVSSRQVDGFRASFGEWTWQDYLADVFQRPSVHLRTAFQLMRDAIAYFGFEEQNDRLTGKTFRHYRIFDDPFMNHENRVIGQDLLLNSKLVDYVEAAARESQIERGIFVIGPPGTGKSNVVKNVINCLKQYTNTKEGIVATVAFLFDARVNLRKGPFGFTNDGLPAHYVGPVQKKHDEGKYDEGVHTVVCAKRDHPLLLLPKQDRQDLVSAIQLHRLLVKDEVPERVKSRLVGLDVVYAQRKTDVRVRELWARRIGSVAKKFGVFPDLFMPRKLLIQEPCTNCKNVMRALHIMYTKSGLDVNEDMFSLILRNHVEVRRVQFANDVAGIAEVKAKDPNTQTREVLSGDSEERLLDMFPDLKWRQYLGAVVKANRGAIYYNEVFLLDSLLSLFGLIQDQRETVAPGIQEDCDAMVIGDSNVPPYQRASDNTLLSRPLMERSHRIMMGYLTQRSHEEGIYKNIVARIGKTKRFEPHTHEMITLFAVATRLNKPSDAQYKSNSLLMSRVFEKEFALPADTDKFVRKLDPMKKARLLDGDLSPFSANEQALARNEIFVTMLRREYEDEAMDGMSPRHVQDFYGRLSNTTRSTISAFDFFEILRDMLDKRTVTPSDAPEQERQVFGIEHPTRDKDVYKNPDILYGFIQMEFARVTQGEVEIALTSYSRESVVLWLKKYFEHAIAYVQNRQLFNPITHAHEPPNESVMADTERLLDMPVGKGTREALVQQYGSESIEAQKCKRVQRPLEEVFAREVTVLQRGLYKQKKEYVRFSNLKDALNSLNTEEADWSQKRESDSPEMKKCRDLVYEMTKIGYSPNVARRIVLMHHEKKTIDL
ncbi:hypothetical protein HY490_02885 [Candidatus Woesearchaeota archaeon]|nr:hypothetical protein [Candidatus Woesearchaeota archaeon]